MPNFREPRDIVNSSLDGGFSLDVGKHPETCIPAVNGVLTLRQAQRECWEKLRDARRRDIASPTGSGKSVSCKALTASDLLNGYAEKAMITVPQTIIGSGFQPSQIYLPGKPEPITWAAGHRLTDTPTKNVQERLRRFCETPPGYEPLNADRILVCSHAALVAYAQCGAPCFENISLVVDEAHHSRFPDPDEDEDTKNRLADVLDNWLQHDYGPLTLATATWFRSDRRSILPKEQHSTFTRYTLSMPDYLDSLQYLKKIEIRFLAGDPEDCIRRCYTEDRDANTIVYLRPVTPERDKYAELRQLIALLEEFQIPQSEIVDLVTDKKSDRDKVKKQLTQSILDGAWDPATKRQTSNPQSCLLALLLGREGFDLPALQRSIVMGARGMLSIQQMIGRLTRDYPGKKRVQFNIVLPFSAGDLNDGERIRMYTKVMLSVLTLGCCLQPPRFKSKKDEEAFKKIHPDDLAAGLNATFERVPDGPVTNHDALVQAALRAARLGTDAAERRAFNEVARHAERQLLDYLPDPEMAEDDFAGVRAWRLIFGHKDLAALNRVVRAAPSFSALEATQLIFNEDSPEKAQYDAEARWHK